MHVTFANSLLSFLFLLLSTVTLARPAVLVGKVGYAGNGRLRLPREPSLSVFYGSIGDIPAAPITASGTTMHPYLVDGTLLETFAQAAQKSCSTQHEQCIEAANNGALDFGLGDCGKQSGEFIVPKVFQRPHADKNGSFGMLAIA